VLRQGSVLLAAGLAAGAALSLWSASLLDRFLYAVEPSDPLTLALAAAALAAVGLLACYLPARRASRIDPMRALRCDG
jgi:putative ABC transport system permease protein